MKLLMNKTMMIICEGTVTEPKYLNDLVSEIQQKAPNYKIIISPVPPKEELEEENKQSYKRKPRKRRIVKEVEDEPNHLFIPEVYRAQPLEYVWRAREALNVYGEVWAVFDRDEHPALSDAFELAKKSVDSKFVNIAFSSRSFEMWLLLHFELNTKNFVKTLCRTRTYLGKGKKKKKHDEYHLCGEGKSHPKDCKGEICITGYMKENNFIPKDIDIKNVSFKGIFRDNVFVAMEHALRLRKIVGSKESKSLDKLDPFTDFDRLVFKLINIEYDYQWIQSHTFNIKNVVFNVLVNDNLLVLNIQNNSNVTYIFSPEHFCLLDIRNNFISYSGEGKAIDKNKAMEIVLFNLEEIGNFTPAFLRISVDSKMNRLIEL
ncbi:RloB family protein [Chryseobacterium sp. 22458]|uniref:RloB family protein n=1 Tax=Chryseobacterium sp. 22458 TaxID=3453921 RepID=UPI003F875BD2